MDPESQPVGGTLWFNPSAVITRRILAASLALGLVSGACAIGVTSQPQPGPGPSTVDVPEPAQVDWRRTVAGIEVAGVATAVDLDELAMLERALDELPEQLVAAAGMRRIYRVVQGESTHGTAAYALGPDVYLVDATFRDLGAGMSTFDLVRLLAHELVHVAQFTELTTDDIEQARASGGDPLARSAFVLSFARAVGWTDRTPTAAAPTWVLDPPGGTTQYGATAPEEDMAETVAEIVSGPEPAVSTSRRAWAETWLASTEERLAGGRPWVPAGTARIVSGDPLYDEDAVARRATDAIEVVSFSLAPTVPAAPQLAATIQSELASRGVAGRFTEVEDRRIDRRSGQFSRGDGLTYWVEVWDFRDAPGFVDPIPAPVVTYVALWP